MIPIPRMTAIKRSHNRLSGIPIPEQAETG